jgi:phosphoribosylanthranilate isomerase
MLIQVYEISSPEEALAISVIGVDHVGVLVGDGEFPREQSLSSAAAIAAGIVAIKRFSALFLACRADFIIQWARELRPSILHLGAAPELLSPALVTEIKQCLPGITIMRSVPVVGEESIAIAQSYEAIADYILLDSHSVSDKQIGALGVTHDWDISRRIVELLKIPVILAGGLGPDNVSEAIKEVRPAGVDSKTKTDKEGSHAKDLDRVRRFVEAARAASRRPSVLS